MSTIACKSKRNDTKRKGNINSSDNCAFEFALTKKNHIKRNGHARKQAIALKYQVNFFRLP